MSIDSRPFSYDPMSGIETIFHFDEDTEEFSLEKRFDITELLEINKYLANNEEYKVGADIRRVASIPTPLLDELKRKGIWDERDPHQKRFHAWLNDRDNMAFRTNTELL